MIQIEKIDPTNGRQVRRFIQLPHNMYGHDPHWVPLLNIDARLYFNRRHFPFYRHSTADFFLATRNGKEIGRIAVLENRLYNDYHQTKQGQIYFFDCEDNVETAGKLFNKAQQWAKERNLTRLVGPKGFTAMDSFGILIEGFNQRQTMGFTTYNAPYYQALFEAHGWQKEVDFVSSLMRTDQIKPINWIHQLAEQIKQQESLHIATFKTRRQAIRAGTQLFKEVYNQAFTQNWEYYPAPDYEIQFLLNNLKWIGMPELLKVIQHKEQPVGFLMAIPDYSKPLQQAKGRLTPRSLYRLRHTRSRSDTLVVYVLGILESYRQSGGQALLVSELEKAIRQYNPTFVELVNNAETAVEARNDLDMLGFKHSKIHRVYQKSV